MLNTRYLTRIGVGLALAALLAVAAACGGGDSGSTATTGTTQPAQPAEAPAAAEQPTGITSAAMSAPTAVPAMAPRSPVELMAAEPEIERLIVGIVPFGQESNVRRIVGQISAVQFDPIDESLVGMDPTTGQKVPELATEWAIEGGNALRFKLEKGVQFHNGWGELTAKDVQFAYEEYRSDDAIGGARRPLRSLVDNIEAVNSHEVVIHLQQFDADLINLLSRAQPAVSIVSKANADALGADPDFDTGPLAGTGPYQFLEREQNAYFRYKRNENHRSIWPDFPEFEYRYINEASTRLAALLTDEIHVTSLPDDLYAQALADGMEVIQGSASLRRVFMRYQCCYVDLSTQEWPIHPDSPLQDVRVRKALNKAVNRAELNEGLFGNKGLHMSIHSYNPNLEGWDQSWVDRFPEAYGYDPAAARALLAEAGYNANNPLEINVHSFKITQLPGADDVSAVIGEYIREIGVKVDFVQEPASSRNAKLRTQQYTRDLVLGTTSAGQIVGAAVYSSNTVFARTATTPQLDAKMRELRAEPSDARRTQLWTEFGELVYTNYINMPLFWLPAEVLVNPEVVSGFVWPGALSGFWSHLWQVKAA